MLNLTLRTLLAYIDDTLDPAETRELGEKVADSPVAQELIERIKRVIKQRGLIAPPADGSDDDVGDPNTVADYLNSTLDDEQVTKLELACMVDDDATADEVRVADARLAELAACHQILTLVLAEPVRVAPRANQRMYKLVEAPASLPNRKPGKAVPVGVEPDPADESDAALLLGMKRYSQSGSDGGRLGVFAAVGVLGLLLAVAVLMALPHNPALPPPTSPGVVQVVQATKPAVVPDKPKPDEVFDKVAPPPKPVDITASKPDPKPDNVPKPAVVPDADLVPPPAEPLAGRSAVGPVVTPNVIVVSRGEQATTWTRHSPEGAEPVSSGDQVVALPGYKAEVRLDSDVDVYLWGNVPELLSPRPGLGRGPLEARVRFHVPEKKLNGKGQDFDADLTVLAGRVYLSQNAKRPKPDGARVRVRVSDEVWDVTLPDAKTEVMVEVVTAFVPGTPFLREGGDAPRVEGKLAVVRGAADVAMPKRFKTFPKVAAPSVLFWDSKGGRVIDPKPFDKIDPTFEKLQLGDPQLAPEVQKALTEMAARLTDKKTTVKLLLAERLSEPPDGRRAVVARVAVYCQAAIAADANDLKPLVDALSDSTRRYARSAAVTALAAWVARGPKNAALLRDELVSKARFPEGEADLALKLLLGYLPPGKPVGEDLDKLVDLLASSNLAVRELALWNLVVLVDPDAEAAGFAPDVGVTAPGYEKFVRAWKLRAEEIKKK